MQICILLYFVLQHLKFYNSLRKVQWHNHRVKPTKKKFAVLFLASAMHPYTLMKKQTLLSIGANYMEAWGFEPSLGNAMGAEPPEKYS